MILSNFKKIISLLFLILYPSISLATPQIKDVPYGKIEVIPHPATLATTINVEGNKTVIKWDKFHLAKPETLNFRSPQGSWIINYIQGGGAIIDGKITSKNFSDKPGGNLILVNPQGILIGNHAIIEAGSFAAISAYIPDMKTFVKNFVEQDTLSFVKGDGDIINRGNIYARQGFIYLIGRTVDNTNTGQIVAQGEAVVLKNYLGTEERYVAIGDNLIKFVIDKASGMEPIPDAVVKLEKGELAKIADYAVHAPRDYAKHLVKGRDGTLMLVSDNTERHIGQVKQQGKLFLAGQHAAEVTLSGEDIVVYPHSIINVNNVGWGKNGKIQIQGENSIYIDQRAILKVNADRTYEDDTVRRETVALNGEVHIMAPNIASHGLIVVGSFSGDGGKVIFDGQKFQLTSKIITNTVDKFSGLVVIHGRDNVTVTEFGDFGSIKSSWLEEQLKTNKVILKTDEVSGSINIDRSVKLKQVAPSFLKLIGGNLRFAGSLELPHGKVVLETDFKTQDSGMFPIQFAAGGKFILAEEVKVYLNVADFKQTFDLKPYVDAQQLDYYYWIHDITEWAKIASNLSGNYALKNDLDFKKQPYIPIGHSYLIPFTGKLDGQNKTISNIAIRYKDQASLDAEVLKNRIPVSINPGAKRYSTHKSIYTLGLFGTVMGGSISQLNLRGFEVLGGEYVIGGALAGLVVQNSQFDHISIDGVNIDFAQYSSGGGMLGGAYEDVGISNITLNDIHIRGGNASYLGGLVANIYSGKIDDVRINKLQLIGGNGFYYNGKILIEHAVGGMSGVSVNSLITRVGIYDSKIIVHDFNTTVGGVVGILENSELDVAEFWGSAGAGSTHTTVGGVVGENKNSVVSRSHSHGNVSVGEDTGLVGGFIGFNSGLIKDSYTTSSVTVGLGSFGGAFAGHNGRNPKRSVVEEFFAEQQGKPTQKHPLIQAQNALIENTYATGNTIYDPTQKPECMGFVGLNEGTIKDSYYDENTTGLKQAAELYPEGTKKLLHVQGLTTSKLVHSKTYKRWDREIWVFPEDRQEMRPLLKEEMPHLNTKTGKIELYTPHHLYLMGNMNYALERRDADPILRGSFQLKSDIYFEPLNVANIWAGKTLRPLPALNGTFDGQDHTISGINIELAKNEIGGFFKTIGVGGAVKNLKLSGELSVASDAVGGLLTGAMNARTLVDNVAVIGNVVVLGENSRAGLLAGYAKGDLRHIRTQGTLYGGKKSKDSMIGGIAGAADMIVLRDSWSDVKFKIGKNTKAGGLIGVAGRSVLVSTSLAMPHVEQIGEGSIVGGIFGKASIFNSSDRSYYLSDDGVKSGYGNKPDKDLFWRFLGTTEDEQRQVGEPKDVYFFRGLSKSELSDYTNYKGWNFRNEDIPNEDKTWFWTGDRARLIYEWSQEIKEQYLLQLMFLHPTAKYYLTRDLDLSSMRQWNKGEGYHILGNKTFQGEFDGQGYALLNFFGNRLRENVYAFFPILKQAYIHDFSFTGEITSSDRGYDTPHIALLVGDAYSSVIDHVDVNGRMRVLFTLPAKIGGVVGSLDQYSALSRSKAQVVIDSQSEQSNIAALVAENWGHIFDSYSYKSSINAPQSLITAGLVATNRGHITNSYAYLNELRGTSVAGLVGINEGGLSNSYVYILGPDSIQSVDPGQRAFAVWIQRGIIKNVLVSAKGLVPSTLMPLVAAGVPIGGQFIQSLRDDVVGFDRDIWHTGMGHLPFFLWDKYLVSLDALPRGRSSLFTSSLTNASVSFDVNKNYVFIPRQNLKVGDTVGFYSALDGGANKLLMLHIYGGEKEVILNNRVTPGVVLFTAKPDTYFDLNRIKRSIQSLMAHGIPKQDIPLAVKQKKKDRFSTKEIDIHGDFKSDGTHILQGKIISDRYISFMKPVILFHDITLQGEKVVFEKSAAVLGLDSNLNIKAKQVVMQSEVGIDSQGPNNVNILADESYISGTWHTVHDINVHGRLNLLGDLMMISGLGGICYDTVVGGPYALTSRSYKGVTFNGNIGEDMPLAQAVFQETMFVKLNNKKVPIFFHGNVNVSEDLDLHTFHVGIGENSKISSLGAVKLGEVHGGTLVVDGQQIHMIEGIKTNTLTSFGVKPGSTLFLYDDMFVKRFYHVMGNVTLMRDAIYIDSRTKGLVIGKLDENTRIDYQRGYTYRGIMNRAETLLRKGRDHIDPRIPLVPVLPVEPIVPLVPVLPVEPIVPLVPGLLVEPVIPRTPGISIVPVSVNDDFSITDSELEILLKELEEVIFGYELYSPSYNNSSKMLPSLNNSISKTLSSSNSKITQVLQFLPKPKVSFWRGKGKYNEYKERLSLLHIHGTDIKNILQHGVKQLYLHLGKYQYADHVTEQQQELDFDLSSNELLRVNLLNKHIEIDLAKLYSVQ